MADPTSSSDRTAGRDAETPPGVPRWVKICAVTALVVIVLVVIATLAGGDHGPGRHAASGLPDRETPALSAARSGGRGGHQPPVGARSS